MYHEPDQFAVSYEYSTYDFYQAWGSKSYYNSKYNFEDFLYYELQYKDYNPALKVGEYYNYWANPYEGGDYSEDFPFNYKQTDYDETYDGPIMYDTPEGYWSLAYESFWSEYYNPDNTAQDFYYMDAYSDVYSIPYD